MISRNIKEKVVPTSIVGTDLGVKDLVVTSAGEKYNNPKEIRKQEFWKEMAKAI